MSGIDVEIAPCQILAVHSVLLCCVQKCPEKGEQSGEEVVIGERQYRSVLSWKTAFRSLQTSWLSPIVFLSI
jgi:hypothetical protein